MTQSGSILLDLKAIQSSPDYQILLQLVIGSNDLQALEYLSRSVPHSKDVQSPEDDFFYGVRIYLNRLRLSHLYELIDSPIRAIRDEFEKQNAENCKQDSICHLISEDLTCDGYWKQLREYLVLDGMHSGFYDYLTQFRNNLGFHLSGNNKGKVLKQGLALLIQEKSDLATPAIGKVVRAVLKEACYSRYAFADDIQMVIWRAKFGQIDHSENYEKSERAKMLRDNTHGLTQLLNDFTECLSGLYLRKYKLALRLEAGGS